MNSNEMAAYQFALQQKVLRNWARPASARAAVVMSVRGADGRVVAFGALRMALLQVSGLLQKGEPVSETVAKGALSLDMGKSQKVMVIGVASTVMPR